MKKKTFMILAVLTMAMAGCKGNKGKETMDLLQAVEQDTVTHSMAACDFNDSLRAWNSHVTFVIHREPCYSLPVVMDQYGTKFWDNIFELTIEKDGKPFLKRQFTKKDFASLITEEFSKHGMFDGFRCIGYEDGQLTFCTCVSYPESDMTQPFLVKVAQDGNISIEHDKTPINENPADSCIDEERV